MYYDVYYTCYTSIYLYNNVSFKAIDEKDAPLSPSIRGQILTPIGSCENVLSNSPRGESMISLDQTSSSHLDMLALSGIHLSGQPSSLYKQHILSVKQFNREQVSRRG